MIDEEVDFLAECFRRRLHILERHTVTGAECMTAIRSMPRLPVGNPYLSDVRGAEVAGGISYGMVWDYMYGRALPPRY